MAMKYRKGTFTTVPNIKILKTQESKLQALFMWLCIYSDENGKCFPSRSRLAKDCQTTVRTIDRYMIKLIKLGLITKEIRKDKTQKNKNITNIYQIMVIDELDGVGDTTDTTPSDTRDTTLATPETLPLATPELQRTKSNLTKSNELSNFGSTLDFEKEANRVVELFSFNKDYRSFYNPGPQRTSIHKLIKFSQEDNIAIDKLIQLAKDAQGKEYAPQIFTPSDLVYKYSKLLTYNNKPSQNMDPEETYAREMAKLYPPNINNQAEFKFLVKYGSKNILKYKEILGL